jgi:hypothetical protein
MYLHQGIRNLLVFATIAVLIMVTVAHFATIAGAYIIYAGIIALPILILLVLLGEKVSNEEALHVVQVATFIIGIPFVFGIICTFLSVLAIIIHCPKSWSGKLTEEHYCEQLEGSWRSAGNELRLAFYKDRGFAGMSSLFTDLNSGRARYIPFTTTLNQEKLLLTPLFESDVNCLREVCESNDLSIVFKGIEPTLILQSGQTYELVKVQMPSSLAELQERLYKLAPAESMATLCEVYPEVTSDVSGHLLMWFERSPENKYNLFIDNIPLSATNILGLGQLVPGKKAPAIVRRLFRIIGNKNFLGTIVATERYTSGIPTVGEAHWTISWKNGENNYKVIEDTATGKRVVMKQM